MCSIIHTFISFGSILLRTTGRTGANPSRWGWGTHHITWCEVGSVHQRGHMWRDRMIHTHIHDFGQLIVTTDINHKLNWTVGGNQRTSPTEHPQPIHVYTIQEDDQFPPVVFLLWGSVAHFTCACPQFISQKGNRWDTEWLNDFHVPFDTTRNILTWTPPAKRRHKLLLKSFSCCINGEQTCLYLLSAPKNLFPTAHFSHRPLIKIHISNNFFIFVSRLHHLLLVQDSAFRHQREKCFLTKWL